MGVVFKAWTALAHLMDAVLRALGEEQPCRCPQCRRTFRTNSAAVQHRRDKHGAARLNPQTDWRQI